jgi:predicted nucleic acid-binding protein
VSAFFDTNILLHAQQAGAKGTRARALLSGGGTLSIQVLNEFTAVARRKLGKQWREIGAAISDVLALLDPPLALTLELHDAARALAEGEQLSFYNALIIASAIGGGCDVLYSEDMQHGRSISGLAIVNPFLESGA